MENMAFNKLGIAPPDAVTNVGKFRLMAGDSEYQPLSPPTPGLGLYQAWSDQEISAFLEISNGSVARAISLAYTQIAASYAASGATIKTDDLSYSSKDSVGSWQNLAKYWADIADREEGRAADDMFIMVDTAGPQPWFQPEGSPRIHGSFPPAWNSPGYSGNGGTLDGGAP